MCSPGSCSYVSLMCVWSFGCSKEQSNVPTVPIAWPIAKLLDWALGSHNEHTYKKAELKSFLQFHRSGQEPLRDEEISILNGVLSLNEKSAAEIMTPWKVSRRDV